MDNNGWPGKPGVPLNPERDGAHVLRFPSGNQRTWIWRATPAPFWVSDTSRSVYPQDIVSFEAIYVGPCLTPAEVEARIAQARRDAREEAARWHDEQRKSNENGLEYSSLVGIPIANAADLRSGAQTHEWCAAAIRALKGEGDD